MKVIQTNNLNQLYNLISSYDHIQIYTNSNIVVTVTNYPKEHKDKVQSTRSNIA